MRAGSYHFSPSFSELSIYPLQLAFKPIHALSDLRSFIPGFGEDLAAKIFGQQILMLPHPFPALNSALYQVRKTIC
jgi:hypothetical protein